MMNGDIIWALYIDSGELLHIQEQQSNKHSGMKSESSVQNSKIKISVIKKKTET